MRIRTVITIRLSGGEDSNDIGSPPSILTMQANQYSPVMFAGDLHRQCLVVLAYCCCCFAVAALKLNIVANQIAANQ